MLGPVGETEFDLRFYCFGVPVRVHPMFWGVSLFMAWRGGGDARGIITWITCVFVSILVHEMGHAVVIRKYGFPSQIVLHGMGGYATSRGFTTWKSIWVSFAGPLAGFILGGLVYLAELWMLNYKLEWLRNEDVYYFVLCMKYINFYWGLVNLLPILPLDGGHIMQVLMLKFWRKKPQERIYQISIVTAGGMAYWGYQTGQNFVVILFILLCANNVIQYNEMKNHRRW